MIAVIVD